MGVSDETLEAMKIMFTVDFFTKSMSVPCIPLGFSKCCEQDDQESKFEKTRKQIVKSVITSDSCERFADTERKLWPKIFETNLANEMRDYFGHVVKSTLPSLSPRERFRNVIISMATGLKKLNMDIDEDIVTLEQVQEAYNFLRSSSGVVRTPTLSHVQSLFVHGVSEKKVDIEKVDLFMKMENMQTTGSFKIRGVLNQMRKIKERYGEECKLKVVTMSAGNYGKAFAHCVGGSFVSSICVMPQTAPDNRVTLIKSMGVDVIKVDTADIQSEVDRLVQEDFIFCHPFDDIDLIAGYASSALEVLEDVPDPDIVLVCCGGGGLVSGVAAGISLSKVKNCKVYAVEPEGAPTMYESFRSRRPVTLPHVKSIAAGLSPPYAGSTCYKHCHWFVDDVLLVSDSEILHAMSVLFGRGIKAEPSGCAALAALLSGKVPDAEGKKVVVYITGGNVSISELPNLIKESEGSCQN